MAVGRFFAMVGALVRRPSDGRYLVLRRSEGKDFAAGEWECVTGRVDQGESFSEAVRREVYEELGVEAQVEFIVGTTHFYRGAVRPENEIVGVQYCCSIETPEAISKSWEHAQYRWVTAEEAEASLPATHWLGKTIRRAEAVRALLPSELLDFYAAHGFEL